jgi:hypothetical protein
LEAALDSERLARAAAEARATSDARQQRKTPDEEEWDELEAAAAAFKAGRDRAVARLDAAHAEADRATAEVAGLAAALADATERAARWEGAAADAAARADRLADLLEESAGGGGERPNDSGDKGDLEAALAAERARSARLEATCAALCVEAGRAGGLTAAVAAAVLPALAEVEDRLAGLRIPIAAVQKAGRA